MRPCTYHRRRIDARVLAAALCAAIGLTGAGATPGASAQEWPARPITVVLPFGAGGMMDFATRSLAAELSKTLAQPVMVEFKAGAGGAIGTAAVAKAEPDGYTLLVTAIGPAVFRPLLEKNVADVGHDMTPVIMIGDTPNAIMASPKLGVNTISELIAYARAHENRLNIGHPGVGTMGEFCGLALAAKTKIEGNMIAYRGATQIIVDLVGGQIDLGTPAYGPGSEAAKLLAVSGDARLESLPNVPTLKESGVDLECATWLAIYGPAALPRPIVDRLNAAVDAFLRKPETHEAFAKVGFRPIGGSPERLRARVIADRATWAPIVGGKRAPENSAPQK
jgi:tripartite-type tricarboxylate transporter receptor subunit TctC